MNLSDELSIGPNDVLVKISFKCDNPAGASINDWEPIKDTINFEAPDVRFERLLEDALVKKKSDEQKLIGRLKRSKQELHMYPAIDFEDWRDLYLKPDLRAMFNFEHVSDLFFDSDPSNKVLPVTFTVAIGKLGTEADTFLRPNDDEYYAFGWRPARLASHYEVSHGKPLEGARVTSLVKNTKGVLKPYTVESWFMEGRHLGDIQDRKILEKLEAPARPFLNGSDQKDPEKLGAAIRDKIEKLHESTSSRLNSCRTWVPTVPKLSFQPYIPNHGSHVAATTPIPVAIRFVNRLSLDQEVVFPRTGWVDVRCTASPSSICQDLREYLRGNPEKDKEWQNVSHLFSEDKKDSWNLDLWIMPQGQNKLRYWWSGDLLPFLQQSRVNDGWRLSALCGGTHCSRR